MIKIELRIASVATFCLARHHAAGLPRVPLAGLYPDHAIENSYLSSLVNAIRLGPFLGDLGRSG